MLTAAWLVMAVAVGYAVWFWVRPVRRAAWEIDHLEQNARKVVTGSELQKWATNLLTHPVPDGMATAEQFKTDFPPQLHGLFSQPAFIWIDKPTNDFPGKVWVVWGGGFVGDCGFEIGPTSFADPAGSHAHAWQDGVYFWSEHPQR